jgi:hypothetical protein
MRGTPFAGDVWLADIPLSSKQLILVSQKGLELAALREARRFVGCHEAILNVLRYRIDGVSILFVTGTCWVATERVVVGMDKVVFHGDGNGALELHCAFSLRVATRITHNACVDAIIFVRTRGA